VPSSSDIGGPHVFAERTSLPAVRGGCDAIVCVRSSRVRSARLPPAREGGFAPSFSRAPSHEDGIDATVDESLKRIEARLMKFAVSPF